MKSKNPPPMFVMPTVIIIMVTIVLDNALKLNVCYILYLHDYRSMLQKPYSFAQKV